MEYRRDFVRFPRRPNPNGASLVDFMQLIKQDQAERTHQRLQALLLGEETERFLQEHPAIQQAVEVLPGLSYLNGILWVRGNAPELLRIFPLAEDSLRQAEDADTLDYDEALTRFTECIDSSIAPPLEAGVELLDNLLDFGVDPDTEAYKDNLRELLVTIAHEIDVRCPQALDFAVDECLQARDEFEQHNIALRVRAIVYIAQRIDFNFLHILFTRLHVPLNIDDIHNRNQVPFAGADLPVYNRNFDTTGHYFDERREALEEHERELAGTPEFTDKQFIDWLELYAEGVSQNQLDLSIVTTTEEIRDMLADPSTPREDITAYAEILDKMLVAIALTDVRAIEHVLDQIWQNIHTTSDIPYTRRYTLRWNEDEGMYNQEDMHNLRLKGVRVVARNLVRQTYPDYELPPVFE